jgi:hypothetical protein
MSDNQAEVVFQLFNVLAAHSPDPHETYEYLIHTICGDTDSLNAIVGTLCSLTDEFRRNHNAEPTGES